MCDTVFFFFVCFSVASTCTPQSGVHHRTGETIRFGEPADGLDGDRGLGDVALSHLTDCVVHVQVYSQVLLRCVSSPLSQSIQ